MNTRNFVIVSFSRDEYMIVKECLEFVAHRKYTDADTADLCHKALQALANANAAG